MPEKMQLSSFVNEHFSYYHEFHEDFAKMIDHKLHYHSDLLEITYIMRGDVRIRTELGTYEIEPYDIFVARPNEMHGIARIGGTPYDRRNIYIKESFFKANRCEHYLTFLNEHAFISSSVINAKRSQFDIVGLINSFENCVRSGNTDDILLESMIVQYLYMIMHSGDESSEKLKKNEKINDVIMYINEHITEDIQLDRIAAELYINKQYMCKIFKKYTGFTIKNFITEKRLQMVNELYRQDINLLEASLRSGFKSYSSFYRAYIDRYGCAPQKRMGVS